MLTPTRAPAQIAKQILDALVIDVRLQARDLIYEEPLRSSLIAVGFGEEDIHAGLEHAEERGWLTHDAGERVYVLTRAGFAWPRSPEAYGLRGLPAILELYSPSPPAGPRARGWQLLLCFSNERSVARLE